MGAKPLDIIRIGNRAGAMLDWLDLPVLKMCTLSDTEICLQTDSFDLAIRIETDRNLPTLDRRAALFLALDLTPVADAAEEEADDRLHLSILAHLLRVLHGRLSPDYVQWVHPLALLSHAEFLAAVTPEDHHAAHIRERPRGETSQQSAAPISQPARARLPDIEATNNALQDRFGGEAVHSDTQSVQRADNLRDIFREDGAITTNKPHADTTIREETDPLRLTVWMMTITLAIFALPVAAGLAVVNLLRGENLRLASQTAALTGLFMSLNVTGATAQAVQTLQGLL